MADGQTDIEKAFPFGVPDSETDQARAVAVLRAALGDDPKEAIGRVFQVLGYVVKPSDENVLEVRRAMLTWVLSADA